MRAVIAMAVVLVACTAPPATPSQTATESVAVVASPSATPLPSSPAATPSPSPSPSATPATSPVSAGTVPDAGILFISDYDPPDGQQSAQAGLYRYDGTTGALTRVDAVPFAIGPAIAHDGPAGAYLRGPNGRWDLLRWNGTRASDSEFTACQSEPNLFASFCTVTRGGVGIGYGTHTGACSPQPAFVRYPGDARGRPILADLCVQAAWASDDGRTILARALAKTGQVGGACELAGPDGTCYRVEAWVLADGTPRKLQALSDLAGDIAVSPDGRSAVVPQPSGLVLVDLASGSAAPLGRSYGSPQWSKDGRLAFVRGARSEPWIDKTIVVATPGGSSREIQGGPVGLAPVWDPAGRRLAWIASRSAAEGTADQIAADLLAGRGVGDRRVLMSDLSGDPEEIRCGEGVAEGVRWSHDGSALLLLCRRPGLRTNAFDLWLYPLGLPGGHVYPLVRGLTLGGFEMSAMAPSLLNVTGWSRGLDIVR
jgi:hypothetical protein